MKVVVHWIVILVIWWVLMEGGVTRAAAVATWALVRARGDVLFGVVALRILTTRRFRMRSRLAESVGMFVGVTGLCTLGTDGCVSKEHVILLLSIVLAACTFGGTCTLGTRDMLGVCTLGTRCMVWLVEDVATSLNWSGRACKWAFVASMIRWRSCAASSWPLSTSFA